MRKPDVSALGLSFIWFWVWHPKYFSQVMNFHVCSSLVVVTWGAYHLGVCRHSILKKTYGALSLHAWTWMPGLSLISIWTRLLIPSRLFSPQWKEMEILLQELENGACCTHWVLLALHCKCLRKFMVSHDLHYFWHIYSGTFLHLKPSLGMTLGTYRPRRTC